jgi:hypothetical protein
MKHHVDMSVLVLGPELRVDSGQPTARAAPAPDAPRPQAKADMRERGSEAPLGATIEARAGEPIPRRPPPPPTGDGGGGRGPGFHKRVGPEDFNARLQEGRRAVWSNLSFVLVLTCATNLLILAIPIYLFQISDRVLTSRSTDTLIMLTTVIAGAVILYAMFDAIRRFILMRTAVEVAAQLGAPVLSAAALRRCTERGASTRRWATCSRCARFWCPARCSRSSTCPLRRSSYW